ncbi:LysM domain protein [Pseudoflavonifractor capillosus ATCC 29799]|uniref:LysM domain protein n=2 Tax=Pseudoflavonifractor capillosus TaxID=106588 RepID=A6NQ18_9FIRM|nr:LysM domain protein [Pseudoflavonifractor capillosus ATCC 29799]
MDMGKLAAMRYKNYVWPHNPRVYTIEYRREVVARKVPFGRYCLQDLGPTRRVMKGEGEFVGQGAYDEFKKLASVFYGEGPGLLVHPVWQSAKAYFAALSLKQEPRADYVSYAFEFWECYDGYQEGLKEIAGETTSAGSTGSGAESGAAYHTVIVGETLWSISLRYGTTVEALVKLNPQLKNPNLIYPGEQVRIK